MWPKTEVSCGCVEVRQSFRRNFDAKQLRRRVKPAENLGFRPVRQSLARARKDKPHSLTRVEGAPKCGAPFGRYALLRHLLIGSHDMVREKHVAARPTRAERREANRAAWHAVVPPGLSPGDERLYRGQRYRLLGVVPHINRFGRSIDLARWESACAECGKSFEVRTSHKWEPNRRCDEHRKPGVRA